MIVLKWRWKDLQKDKILSYLGFATRARKAVSGEFSVEKSIKQRKAKLVIVSEEASQNTRKKFTDMCGYRKIPLYFFGTGEELGRACGKDFRISMAVEDEGLAGAAARELSQ